MGAQKNRLIKTVLLSTHNISFGLEMRKMIFSYTLLSGGLAEAFIFVPSLEAPARLDKSPLLLVYALMIWLTS